MDLLAKSLVKFQSEVPAIEKKRTADIPTKSGGKYSYSYADLADIWEAIRPVLAKNGLAVTQMFDVSSEGSTVLNTTIWHESGQSIASSLPLPTEEKTAQEVGSLFTYYKRYALGAALGLSTEDDDDGKAGNSAPVASSTKPASEKQLDLIGQLAKRAGYGSDWVAAAIMKVNTSADASTLIKKLQEK